MITLDFSSRLDRACRLQLEQLLFLNPGQALVRGKIIEAIRRYGNPRVVEKDGFLRVEIPGFPEAQTLFITRTRHGFTILCGTIIFVRESEENLLVLHMAVRDQYAIHGRYGCEKLLYRMIDQVRDIGRSIKGIRFVEILYAPGGVQKIRV